MITNHLKLTYQKKKKKYVQTKSIHSIRLKKQVPNLSIDSNKLTNFLACGKEGRRNGRIVVVSNGVVTFHVVNLILSKFEQN